MVCDVSDALRAAHLHLFIAQLMRTHTGTHIKFMAFNGRKLYLASMCKNLQEKVSQDTDLGLRTASHHSHFTAI